jgi:hypothetical protein
MNRATTTLYERLGRREGITRITADLMKNHLANPLVRTASTKPRATTCWPCCGRCGARCCGCDAAPL